MPKPPAITQRQVDADHPWLGLESFTEATRKFFFGRDAEIADIFIRTRENPLTVLYGRSGLGKTSLLGAGLIPKLKLEGYRPVLIRLRYERTDIPLVDQMKDAFGTASSDVPHPSYPNLPSLWELLHHIPTRPTDIPTAPPVLIFDQFEELFTLGQRAERIDEVRALFTELADVIENRPPAALKDRFTADRRLVRDYDLAPTPLRVVITLREDYLSHFEAWKRVLPSLMRNRMALHLLNGPQALDAVFKPGQMEGRHLVDEDTAARIVRFVAGRGPDVPLDEIDAVPPLLSLVCDELNAQRLERGESDLCTEKTMIGGRLVPGADPEEVLEARSRAILQRFYERSFAGFPRGVRHFVEDRMVTTAGHRCPVSRDDAHAALTKARVKDPAAALATLVTRRLISSEERGGVQWFEITHDVLVPIVKESKDKRLARQRIRRMIGASAALLALLGVFGGVTAWALKKQREADEARASAVTQRDEARFNEGLAWMLRAEVADERSHRYPDTLLYAAQAIGFEGVGRPPDAELPLRYIRRDRNPEAFARAAGWIRDRPAYRPLWASPLRAAPATALAISPGGSWLALATADDHVSLWEIASGKEEPVPVRGAITDLAFDPQDKALTLAGKNGVLSYEPLATLHSAEAGAIAWSPGGDRLAAAVGGDVVVWEGDKTTTIPSGIATPAVRLAFSPENSLIAAAYPGKGVRLFFPHAGTAAHAWMTHAADATAVAISPDGARIAIGTGDGAVSLWSSADGRQLGIVPAELRHAGAVLDLDFSPFGTQLASASQDGTVKLWAVGGDIPGVIATLCGHTGAVSRVRFLPAGTVLASAGADGSARLWSVSSEKPEVRDLLTYLSRSFYSFDPASQQVGWAGGAGFAGQPPAGLLTPPLPPDRSALLADARAAAKENRWHRVDLRLRQMGDGQDAAVHQLREHRQQFAQQGQPFTNAEGISLRWCPPTGSQGFLMGSPETEQDRYSYETQHKVVLTSGFWLSQHELTQAQWTAVMGENKSTYQSSGPQAPVENVSWDEAVEFCRRLTDRERARGTLPPGWEYALPSEAQWEYACRAGTTTAYYFGDDPALLHKHGNYNDKSANFADSDMTQDDGFKYTAPVGSYRDKETKPNAWGFYDMHGNVFEWCADALDVNAADYGPDMATDPLTTPDLLAKLGKTGSHRVDRGGGFDDSPRICRSADRSAAPPSYRSGNLGFRPAMVPSRPAGAAAPGAAAPEKAVSGSEPEVKR